MRLELIFENLPKHYQVIINSSTPPEVTSKWLKKFIKRDITFEDMVHFLNDRSYFIGLEDYKKNLHFFILNETLNLELEPWDWFHDYRMYNIKNNKEFIRHFKIWNLTRN